MTSAEVMDDEVMSSLPTLSASELEEVCGVVEQEVDAQLKGKKKPLYKFLMKFLCDLTDEEPVIRLIHEHLNKDKKVMPQIEFDEKKIADVKKEDVSGVPEIKEVSSKSKGKEYTKIDFTRLKDLKISVTIGAY